MSCVSQTVSSCIKFKTWKIKSLRGKKKRKHCILQFVRNIINFNCSFHEMAKPDLEGAFLNNGKNKPNPRHLNFVTNKSKSLPSKLAQ